MKDFIVEFFFPRHPDGSLHMAWLVFNMPVFVLWALLMLSGTTVPANYGWAALLFIGYCIWRVLVSFASGNQEFQNQIID